MIFIFNIIKNIYPLTETIVDTAFYDVVITELQIQTKNPTRETQETRTRRPALSKYNTNRDDARENKEGPIHIRACIYTRKTSEMRRVVPK